MLIKPEALRSLSPLSGSILAPNKTIGQPPWKTWLWARRTTACQSQTPAQIGPVVLLWRRPHFTEEHLPWLLLQNWPLALRPSLGTDVGTLALRHFQVTLCDSCFQLSRTSVIWKKHFFFFFVEALNKGQLVKVNKGYSTLLHSLIRLLTPLRSGIDFLNVSLTLFKLQVIEHSDSQYLRVILPF